MLRFVYAFTLLILGVYPLSGTAAPTKSRCRCIAIDQTLPWTSSSALLDDSRPNDVCSYLGPEIEHWRWIAPDEFQSYFEDIVDQIPTATPTEEEMRPLSTSVLMKLSAKKAGGLVHPLPSAPTEASRLRIICRSEPEHGDEYHATASGLLAITVIMVMIILASVAECVDLTMNWVGRMRERRRVIRLHGGEKALYAFNALHSSKEPYTSDHSEDDEDFTRPVL